MANNEDNQALWLAVIGKSLAYLCLNQAEKLDAKRVTGVLKKVRFLEDLGLPTADAAAAAGSTTASVSEMRRLAAKKNSPTRGRKKSGKPKQKRS